MELKCLLVLIITVYFTLLVWSLYPRYENVIPRISRDQRIANMKSIPIGNNVGLFVEEISIESLIPSWKASLCKRGREPAFLVGSRFNIYIQLTNIGTRRFRGGEIFIPVKWTSGRIDFWRKEVPPLNVDETSEPIRLNFGILEPWFGTIHVECQEHSPTRTSPRQFTKNQPIMFTSEKYYSQKDLQFSSVFGQSEVEFFTLWALIVAAIGLIYPILKDVFSFFKCFLY